MQDTPISTISLDPFSNSLNLTALKTLSALLQTSIGPHGKLKIIKNITGGHVTITSSSIRLYHNLSIRNTFLKFILSSAQSQLKSYNNGGLYCALLTLRLIHNALNLPYPKTLIGDLFKKFGELYLICFNQNSNNCVFNVDLSLLSHMLSVVNPVIKSKPACILSEVNQRHLCLALMKIFLNLVPNSSNCTLNKAAFNLQSLEGTCPAECKLYNGLLIRCPETLQDLSQFASFDESKPLKVLLLSISLSGDADFSMDEIEEKKVSVWKEVLAYLRNVMSKVIDDQVNIVVCQKVIHPSLQKLLRDSGILVIDRLGSENANHFQYVTGAQPVLNLSSDFSYGSLTSIEQVTINKTTFILASNTSTPFWTLLVCNYNEEAVNETRVVCQQALDTLFRLLEKTDVCFGGGCTEMYMIKALQIKVLSSVSDITKEFGCSESQVYSILHSFLTSITDVALALQQGSKLNFATESIYNHLWKLQNSDFPTGLTKCVCGQYTANNVPSREWKLLFQSFSDNLCVPESESDLAKPEVIIKESVLLDELSCKVNASFIAFETASLLLRTTVLVSNSS